jgi:serine/threonine protein kinase
MADHVGQQLGNYRLNRLLGQGGFANVYQGEHVYLKTQAAIKVLHARLATSDQDNFLNEARTIAALDHQHIVRVLEFGVEPQDDIPFLVMTYAPHGTLRERHPKGSRLSLASILPYVRQAAAALQYAHEQRVIHRDIKPENMLLGRNDDILLSDFGIALIAQSTQSQSIQAMAGTMAYMAPEQLHGRPRYASDQYSLAIVIYEWLTGERPFQGTFTELASQHMFATPPPLYVKLPGISPDVEQVIMTALSKDPQRRFGSIRAFAHALEQVSHSDQPFLFPQPPTSFTSPAGNEGSSLMWSPTLADSMSHTPPNTFIPEARHTPPTPISAPETPVPAPVTPIPGDLHTPVLSRPAYPPQTVRDQPQARISRRAVVIGLGLSVVGLAGVGGYLYQRVRETSTTTRPPSTSHATPGPQGFVFVTYHGHLLPVYAIAWSPDGKRIASASQDGTVHVWDAATGDRSFTGHTDVLNAVAWTPNDRRIVTGSGDHSVRIWDAFSEKQLFVFSGHQLAVHSVAWSPDKQRIASASDDWSVQVWQAV